MCLDYPMMHAACGHALPPCRQLCGQGPPGMPRQTCGQSRVYVAMLTGTCGGCFLDLTQSRAFARPPSSTHTKRALNDYWTTLARVSGQHALEADGSEPPAGIDAVAYAHWKEMITFFIVMNRPHQVKLNAGEKKWWFDWDLAPPDWNVVANVAHEVIQATLQRSHDDAEHLDEALAEPQPVPEMRLLMDAAEAPAEQPQPRPDTELLMDAVQAPAEPQPGPGMELLMGMVEAPAEPQLGPQVDPLADTLQTPDEPPMSQNASGTTTPGGLLGSDDSGEADGELIMLQGMVNCMLVEMNTIEDTPEPMLGTTLGKRSDRDLAPSQEYDSGSIARQQVETGSMTGSGMVACGDFDWTLGFDAQQKSCQGVDWEMEGCADAGCRSQASSAEPASAMNERARSSSTLERDFELAWELAARNELDWQMQGCADGDAGSVASPAESNATVKDEAGPSPPMDQIAQLDFVAQAGADLDRAIQEEMAREMANLEHMDPGFLDYPVAPDMEGCEFVDPIVLTYQENFGLGSDRAFDTASVPRAYEWRALAGNT